ARPRGLERGGDGAARERVVCGPRRLIRKPRICGASGVYGPDRVGPRGPVTRPAQAVSKPYTRGIRTRRAADERGDRRGRDRDRGDDEGRRRGPPGEDDAA